MSTAQQMPAHYALAFLSEKAELVSKFESQLMRGRQKNTHAMSTSPSSDGVKTYVSTKRVCS